MHAIMKSSVAAMMGIPHVSKKHTTSINGRAFALGHGVQQEESGEVKEAKVRAHLDKLAVEAKTRSENKQ